MSRKIIDTYLRQELQPSSFNREKMQWEVMKTRLDKRSRLQKIKKLVYFTLLVAIIVPLVYVWMPEKNNFNQSGKYNVTQTENIQINKQPSTTSEVTENKTEFISSDQQKNLATETPPSIRKDQKLNENFPQKNSQSFALTNDSGFNIAENKEVPFQTSVNQSLEVNNEEIPLDQSDMVSTTTASDVGTVVVLGAGSTELADSVDVVETLPVQSQSEITNTASESEESVTDLREVVSRLQLIVYAGPQWSVRNLSGQDAGFVSKLGENESQEQTVEAGLNLSYNIKNNISLVSGLNYFSIEQNLVYDKWTDSVISIEDNSYWEPVNTTEWEYDSIRDSLNPANWIYIDSILKTTKDSVYHEIIDTGYVVESNEGFTGKNLIYQLEIPLVVAFEFKKGKFCYGFQTGLGITYMVYRSGKVYLPQGEFKESSSVTYYKSWNFNAHFGLYVDYRVTDKFAVGIEPHLRLPLNSILKNDDIYLSFTNYSFRLRFRYYF